VLLRRVLPVKLGPPPNLSHAGYVRQSVWLWCYVVAWLAALVILYVEWFNLPLLLRAIIGVAEFVFTPDIDVVKRLFRTYAEHEKSLNDVSTG
jgi:hypothetical protein